jgi:diguanylate cyclase (GGDEF)-like protein/PAS domain S-box-containing protein
MTKSTTVQTEGDQGVDTAPAGSEGPVDPRRLVPRLNPSLLAYLMGPAALAAILLLMHFNEIAKEPVWLWVAIFIAIPATSLTADHLYRVHPSRLCLHARVGIQAAGVTTVIYLTGWGPVLSGAFAFLALENVSHAGSRIWRTTAFWSLLGIGIGQLAIAQGWAPSILSLSETDALALMGAFVLFFIIRMAGATMEQKENAESAMRLSEDRYRSLIQNSSDATMVMDELGICTYVSPAITELVGLDSAVFIGQRATDFIHPDDRDRVHSRLGLQLQADSGPTLVQFRMQRDTGGWRDVEAVVANQLDRPSVAGYVANIRDITERKEFEALLAHRALHDPLTGLANRQLILDRAEQMLSRSRRSCEPVAAFFIDLDNFKDANDSLGHEAGDKLLQMVASRFIAMLRASDTVGRLGGDEFVILADDLDDPEATARSLAERAHLVMRDPVPVGERQLHTSVSIGIAPVGPGSDPETCLAQADAAMERAKRGGPARFEAYSPEIGEDTRRSSQLAHELRMAHERGQLAVHYQPLFRSGEVVGMEALLRWRHPSLGEVTPDEFVPLLERSREIVPVGRWVLFEATRQCRAWQSRHPELSVSVNVSVRQLQDPDFVEDVHHALVQSRLAADTLVLEVTESALAVDTVRIGMVMERVRDLGVHLALDDFGTGYSSLLRLKGLPIDRLKIDRSFVSGLGSTGHDPTVIATVVDLAHKLGLAVVAEGVETEEELRAVSAMGCDEVQGFLLARPGPAGAFDPRPRGAGVDRGVGRSMIGPRSVTGSG